MFVFVATGLIAKYCDQDGMFKKRDLLFVKSYLDFCYLQFVQLWGASALRCNGAAVNINRSLFGKPTFIQFHSMIAHSIATFAPYFACQIYQISTNVSTRMANDKAFIVCQKIDEADPPFAILNQPGMDFGETRE